ncbi:uncharacterized protein LOC127764270 isoform X1 [Oryza glaberrima]|uniref:uncharacterized protein LOC127764270 isoform X1 n=1 Tax=Oryza glaberrima TaxID=4538 RepID=UPI00224BFBDB|nr:uncharacterized protein LOC127764270 isoform X1 [Oryza glaberrima]
MIYNGRHPRLSLPRLPLSASTASVRSASVAPPPSGRYRIRPPPVAAQSPLPPPPPSRRRPNPPSCRPAPAPVSPLSLSNPSPVDPRPPPQPTPSSAQTPISVASSTSGASIHDHDHDHAARRSGHRCCPSAGEVCAASASTGIAAAVPPPRKSSRLASTATYTESRRRPSAAERSLRLKLIGFTGQHQRRLADLHACCPPALPTDSDVPGESEFAGEDFEEFQGQQVMLKVWRVRRSPGQAACGMESPGLFILFSTA